jgi:V8-like Glu-specific endopeptidase
VEELTGEGFGTGFVLPGNALKKAWGNALVFVTNAHVLSESDPNAMPPAKARVTLHALRDGKGRPFTTRFGAILATSPPGALDFAIVALKTQPKGLEPIPVGEQLPPLGSAQRLYAIGYPRGGSLSFSMQDNRLIDYGAPDDPRVHYRTPTEPGSSGSPIFDAGWDLVALHHAGSATMKKIHGEGTYEANEGIWFKKIRDQVR